MLWRQIRIRERASASVTTFDYVRSKQVPAGKTWRLHDIAYENETGARGTFRLLIEGHGYEHMIEEVQGPGSGELMTHPDIIYLSGGERLAVKQESCTASDALALYALGEEADSVVIDGKEA